MKYYNNFKRYHILTIFYLIVLIFALIIVYYYLKNLENFTKFLGCDMNQSNIILSPLELMFISNVNCEFSNYILENVFKPLIVEEFNIDSFLFREIEFITHYSIDNDSVYKEQYSKNSKNVKNVKKESSNYNDLQPMWDKNEINIVPTFIIRNLEDTNNYSDPLKFTEDDTNFQFILKKWIIDTLNTKFNKLNYDHSNNKCNFILQAEPESNLCDKSLLIFFGHKNNCEDSNNIIDIINNNVTDNIYNQNIFIDALHSIDSEISDPNNECKYNKYKIYNLIYKYNIENVPFLFVKLNKVFNKSQFENELLGGGKYNKNYSFDTMLNVLYSSDANFINDNIENIINYL